jgi:hypothetical protein
MTIFGDEDNNKEDACINFARKRRAMEMMSLGPEAASMEVLPV